MTYRLERTQVIEAPLLDVFAFFSEARNLEMLTPPWLRFTVVTPEPVRMSAGTLIEYRLRVHRVPLRWVSRIETWEPPNRFIDVQVRGPYRHWHHTHEFEAHEHGTLIRDNVEYRLPLGPLGRLAHAALVQRDLAGVFDYRREQTARILEPLARVS